MSFQQKFAEIERKLRDFNIIDTKKREKLATIGCMTSPLPRRPTPTLAGIMGNGTEDTLRPPSVKHRRHNHPQPPWSVPFPTLNRQSDSAENQKRLEEIMQQTGILRLNGKEYKIEHTDLKLCLNGDLGAGTCGHVVKMLHEETGTIMAVKQMRRSGNKEELKQVIMDLDVVIKHDCPHIVRSYGCFITDSDVWICMELMATCLDKLIKRIKTGIPEAILGKLVVSIVKALHYLKEQRTIIHRDVKPSNMLLDWNGTVKLCDFGISGRLVDSKAKTRTAGCVAYLSPERIEITNDKYDIRADVWSLGISLIELATGKFPYDNCKTDFELLAKIVQEPAPSLPLQKGFSPMFCQFVESCLIKDHKQRPTFRDLLKTEFIRHYENNNVDVASWFLEVSKETTSLDANANVS